VESCGREWERVVNSGEIWGEICPLKKGNLGSAQGVINKP